MLSEFFAMKGGSVTAVVAAAGGERAAETASEDDAENDEGGGMSAIVALASTGFGGKFNFGSFSKGAAIVSSSALGDNVSVVIGSRNVSCS